MMDWLVNNKEWIFSGAGVSFLTLVLSIFLKNRGRETELIEIHDGKTKNHQEPTTEIIIDTLKSRHQENAIINKERDERLLDNNDAQPIIYQNRKSQKRQLSLSQKLHSATKIYASGLGLYELTSDTTTEFYKDFLVKRKGELCLLFLDPNGKEIKARNTIEGRREFALTHIVQSNLKDLSEMVAECYSENPTILQNVEVKFYDRPLRLNSIFVDNDTALIHHYGEKSRGAEAPSFEICKLKNEFIFNWYFKEWEYLLKHQSKPINILSYDSE